MNSAIGTGWAVLIIAIALTIVVLWVLLPFAVFGLKGRVDELIEQQRSTNRWLEAIATARATRADSENQAGSAGRGPD